MRYAGRTHTGLVREINQDSYLVIELSEQKALAVVLADGMGGHNAGELASSLAVEYAAEQTKAKDFTGKNFASQITQIMEEANKLVYTKSLQDITHVGMGTTMIMAIVADSEINIGHVGDSRVYILRNGELKRITTDHSLVEELLQSGAITTEEAENHPSKNVITKALGCEPKIYIDNYKREIENGDKMLLCSDGLTNMVKEQEIRNVLTGTEDPEEAVDKLIEKANNYGGEDNVTAVAVYF